MADDWEEDDEDEPADDPDADLRRDSDSVDTVECPYCGLHVYEHAQRCPHCGRYILHVDAPHRYHWWILIGAMAALAGTLWWAL